MQVHFSGVLRERKTAGPLTSPQVDTPADLMPMPNLVSVLSFILHSST